MLYTPLTKKALKLAYAAHAGQVDKAGMPYIFHPYEVALQVQAEEEVWALPLFALRYCMMSWKIPIGRWKIYGQLDFRKRSWKQYSC